MTPSTLPTPAPARPAEQAPHVHRPGTIVHVDDDLMWSTCTTLACSEPISSAWDDYDGDGHWHWSRWGPAAIPVDIADAPARVWLHTEWPAA